MINKSLIILFLVLIFISCNSVDEELIVIKDTFVELVGQKYYKREVLSGPIKPIIEQAIFNNDYSELYRLDSLLHPFKISDIIYEPEKTDSIINLYCSRYNAQINWFENNNDSLSLVVYTHNRLFGINIKDNMKSYGLDTLSNEAMDILTSAPKSKTISYKVNINNQKIGRFELNENGDEFVGRIFNSLYSSSGPLVVNPFEGYREIGLIEFSRVVFNDTRNTAVFFVMKSLYYDSQFEMILAKKEHGKWIIKEQYVLQAIFKDRNRKH